MKSTRDRADAPTGIRRVLVPVRPRERGLPVGAYHGRVLAERFGASLTLMSAVYEGNVATRLLRDRDDAAAARRTLVESERNKLERLADSIRDWGVEVRTDVRWHHPVYDAILRSAEENRADLVAVEPQDTPLGLRLTDTDWQLMQHCPAPVLYVNEPEFASYETIIAAADPLSGGAWAAPTDHAVLGLARLFADAFGSALHVVHASPDPDSYSWLSATQVEPGVFFDVRNLVEAARVAVERVAAEFGVPAERVHVSSGDPADVILDTAAAEQASLIVMGALSRTDAEQALLGSTTEAVVADAECDVLLVKAEQAPRVA